MKRWNQTTKHVMLGGVSLHKGGWLDPNKQVWWTVFPPPTTQQHQRPINILHDVNLDLTWHQTEHICKQMQSDKIKIQYTVAKYSWQYVF